MPSRSRWTGGSVCGLALLCACASEAPPPRPAVQPPPKLQARVYDCNGAQALVQLRDGAILLTLPSRHLRLERVRSASGARYAAEDTVFWMKGPRAVLELPGEAATRCEEDRPRSLREDARLRGVHYRGRGNEPGWLIEIGPDRILVETDYGETRLVFPMPRHATLTATGHLYEQSTREHELRVAIEDERCLDSMTGEPFDTKVQLTLDGRSFRGCGDVLH